LILIMKAMKSDCVLVVTIIMKKKEIG
jgi:hypothetical protein